MSDHVQAVTHDLLLRELCKITEWDVLGIYLGLDESEITEIERDHQSNARRRIAMLAKWMEKDTNSSWEKVNEALKCMSQIRLANQLKEKYCASESKPPATTAAGPVSEKELMVDRKELIAQEIEDLEEKYLLLVTNVHSAMTEANPSPKKLRMFSKYIKMKVTTVEELLDQLEPYCFLDYALLERIVKFFLRQAHTVLDNLRNYRHQLAIFKSSTTIKEFLESVEQSHSTTSPGLCTIKLHLNEGWLDKTMDDLEKLVDEIFKDKVYVLSNLKIVRGSVILSFSAPLSDADSLIALLLEQSSFMNHVGVSLLVVADTVITQSASSDFSFESSLLFAVQNNNLNLLTFLLNIRTSADACAADESKKTAVMYACQLKNEEAVSQLLKANANPNLQADNGTTSLYFASEIGHAKIITLLLKANADPNLQRKTGETPLFAASKNGHTDTVTLLLKANANPNLQTKIGATPLLIASARDDTDIITLLLGANANPNLQADNGFTPLHVTSHTDVISLLLEANANPNLQANDGSTPLYFASAKGKTDAITLLLKANANPNVRVNNGVTPLHSAGLLCNADAISLLLKANADPDLQADDGTTPLYIASVKNDSEATILLLKANADPNLQKIDGTTPLYMGSHYGHTKIVSLLLKGNADPDLKSKTWETPLHAASRNYHTDVIVLLLKANAYPNFQTIIGVTPLYMACLNGHTDAVSILLKSGADPNLKRDNGTTPLMAAAVNGYSQIIQLLLASGVDPNLQGPNSLTALMIACHTTCLESVELLLTSGADPSITGPDGLTALDMAANKGHKDIVDLLQAMMLSQPSTTSPAIEEKLPML